MNLEWENILLQICCYGYLVSPGHAKKGSFSSLVHRKNHSRKLGNLLLFKFFRENLIQNPKQKTLYENS